MSWYINPPAALTLSVLLGALWSSSTLEPPREAVLILRLATSFMANSANRK